MYVAQLRFRTACALRDGSRGRLRPQQLERGLARGVAVARHLVGGLLVRGENAVARPQRVAERRVAPVEDAPDRRDAVLHPAGVLEDVERQRPRVDLGVRVDVDVLEERPPPLRLHRVGPEPVAHEPPRPVVVGDAALPHRDEAVEEAQRARPVRRVVEPAVLRDEHLAGHRVDAEGPRRVVGVARLHVARQRVRDADRRVQVARLAGDLVERHELGAEGSPPCPAAGSPSPPPCRRRSGRSGRRCCRGTARSARGRPCPVMPCASQ